MHNAYNLYKPKAIMYFCLEQTEYAAKYACIWNLNLPISSIWLWCGENYDPVYGKGGIDAYRLYDDIVTVLHSSFAIISIILTTLLTSKVKNNQKDCINHNLNLKA